MEILTWCCMSFWMMWNLDIGHPNVFLARTWFSSNLRVATQTSPIQFSIKSLLTYTYITFSPYIFVDVVFFILVHLLCHFSPGCCLLHCVMFDSFSTISFLWCSCLVLNVIWRKWIILCPWEKVTWQSNFFPQSIHFLFVNPGNKLGKFVCLTTSLPSQLFYVLCSQDSHCYF